MQKVWHTATKPLKKEFNASGYTAPKKKKLPASNTQTTS
jgi:hypothetical protein